MNIVYAGLLFAAALLLVLAGITRIGVAVIESRNPPVGSFHTVNGTRLHVVHDRVEGSERPAVVFLHGASGNLHDQMVIYRERLAGIATTVFLDRPGHGWSALGPGSNQSPDGQADTLAALLDDLQIEKAIIVGHSFGGAVTASFGLRHPDRTAGLVFLSPVSHVWPGGVSWYYDVSGTPVLGRLFAETLALPGGLMRIDGGTACVFAPNQPTPDYRTRTQVAMVLRPGHFLNNGIQVARLYDHVEKTQDKYPQITAPTVIITGNRDAIVLPEIHSVGLARDLPNAQLLWINNLGHKPDHVLPDLVMAAIDEVSGIDRDLQAMAAQAETSLAGDAYGPTENCFESDLPAQLPALPNT